MYSETAKLMAQTGRLQHAKTMAILRTWDLYSYRHRVDISCGASDAILRVLAVIGAPGHSATIMLGPQQSVAKDVTFLSRPREEVLDPACMPHYVGRLRDVGDVAGFVYASGEYRLWTGESFADRFFDAEWANQRFKQMKILPCFLFGSVFAEQDRAGIYSTLMEYMLGRTEDGREMCIMARTVDRDGCMSTSHVRARYMVLNEGQYACFALSLWQIPGMPNDLVLPQRPPPPPQQAPVPLPAAVAAPTLASAPMAYDAGTSTHGLGNEQQHEVDQYKGGGQEEEEEEVVKQEEEDRLPENYTLDLDADDDEGALQYPGYNRQQELQELEAQQRQASRQKQDKGPTRQYYRPQQPQPQEQGETFVESYRRETAFLEEQQQQQRYKR